MFKTSASIGVWGTFGAADGVIETEMTKSEMLDFVR
jgi:hypothetical protein